MAEIPAKDGFVGAHRTVNSGGFQLDSGRFGTLKAFKVQLNGGHVGALIPVGLVRSRAWAER